MTHIDFEYLDEQYDELPRYIPIRGNAKSQNNSTDDRIVMKTQRIKDIKRLRQLKENSR